MIIKLERYNKVGELLIGKRTTGLQVQVIYWDRVREALVTMAAVHMGMEVMGMQTRNRGTYNRPPSQNRDQRCMRTLWSN